MGQRLLVFGPPGVGKGTHARRLAHDLGIPHIATGDMLRRAIAEGSPLGVQAAAYMNQGALVPDVIAEAILQQRLTLPDTEQGYLLDGFPRNLAQAQTFDDRLSGGAQAGDAVLSLEAPRAVLLQRLTGRQTCAACGATFNRATRPAAVVDRCDACGGALVTRPDDEVATVERRLEAYRAATAPVLSFLQKRGWSVRAVTSVGDVEAVYGRIRAAGAVAPLERIRSGQGGAH